VPNAPEQRPARTPLVAVLCEPQRARVAAASTALALASAVGARVAVAAVAGVRDARSQLASRPASRCAARLVARGYAAAAVGRVAWVADASPSADDVAGEAAALVVVTAGAGRMLGVPAVVALPVARTAALDRVLGWADAVVVAERHAKTPAVAALERASIERLARPTAFMATPSRAAALLAGAGMRATPEAVQAVAVLGRELGWAP
jgi:hypothetical protein